MYNRVELIGHLGHDAELKHTESGTAVANASLATSERWTKDGEKQEKTEWHRLVMWGKLAELAGEMWSKGTLLFVAGKLQTRKWEKDGVARYTTEVVVNEFKFLSAKGEGRGDMPPALGDEDAPPERGPAKGPDTTPSSGAAGTPSPFGGGPGTEEDDDLPF